MSRIGRLPVAIPAGVEAQINGQDITVKGPKGSLSITVNSGITITQEEASIVVRRAAEDRQHRSLHGLTRSLINNMVVGVTEGFQKKLEIHGTGYRVLLKGTTLEFSLGYSHPVVIPAPEGITFAVDGPTKLSVSGIDKQLVGETAARIRKLREPDPYKAKGVRYEGEHIRRKVGKAGK